MMLMQLKGTSDEIKKLQSKLDNSLCVIRLC